MEKLTEVIARDADFTAFSIAVRNNEIIASGSGLAAFYNEELVLKGKGLPGKIAVGDDGRLAYGQMNRVVVEMGDGSQGVVATPRNFLDPISWVGEKVISSMGQSLVAINGSSLELTVIDLLPFRPHGKVGWINGSPQGDAFVVSGLDLIPVVVNCSTLKPITRLDSKLRGLTIARWGDSGGKLAGFGPSISGVRVWEPGGVHLDVELKGQAQAIIFCGKSALVAHSGLIESIDVDTGATRWTTEHQLDTIEQMITMGVYVVFTSNKGGIGVIEPEAGSLIQIKRHTGLRGIKACAKMDDRHLVTISRKFQLSMWDLFPSEPSSTSS